MKTCSKCGVNQPLSQYHKDKARKDGLRSNCKTCYAKFHANYYLANTEKVKLKNKTQWLKRKYNLELETFEQIKTSQNNLCAICSNILNDSYEVHVDHDHKTGKIRGILCRWCNTGLGNFKDSTKSLKSAILYLDKHVNQGETN